MDAVAPLVEAHEARSWPPPPGAPLAALTFAMDRHGAPEPRRSSGSEHWMTLNQIRRVARAAN
jgi:hypothetical protein